MADKPTRPAGKMTLQADCTPTTRRATPEEKEQLNLERMQKLEQIAAKYGIEYACKETRNRPVLQVDGSTVDDVASIQPKQRTDNYGNLRFDHKQNPVMGIDRKEVAASVKAAADAFKAFADASGLSEDVRQVTGKPLKIKVTPPTNRSR